MFELVFCEMSGDENTHKTLKKEILVKTGNVQQIIKTDFLIKTMIVLSDKVSETFH